MTTTTSPDASMDSPRTSTGPSQESRTQTETETETSTTTPSRNDAQGGPRASETALTSRLRSINPVDALTVALLSIRPNWRPEHVAGVLGRDRRPWATVVEAALRCALNPDVQTPAAIENHDTRHHGATPAERHPSALHIRDARNAPRCPNGAIHDPHPCALCRNGIHPPMEDTA